MHVDFDWAAALSEALENSSPESIAAFGHATFSMDAKSHPADSWASLKESGQGVATIGGMIVWGQSLDDMVSVRAIGPPVGVSPQT
jgi:hypothetical protein